MRTDTEEHVTDLRAARAAEGRPALVLVLPVGVAVPLPTAGEVVGRGFLEAHGVLDRKVSAEHARFVRRGGALLVEDVGSRNGTYVDGERLAQRSPVVLREGTVLRLGATLGVVRLAFAGPAQPDPPLGELVSPFGLRALRDRLEELVRRPAPNVLIEGETGTGKELLAAEVARRLRPRGRLVSVNVAGIAPGVFESQLFGHVAGAFSGAGKDFPGIVAAHEGGTVFLDEIGELSLELQPKLLRLLENREVQPVGATRPRQVDVLVVAATHQPLATRVAEGRFRRDLLARLETARLVLPPLRDRAEDLLALVQTLAGRRAERYEPALVEPEALEHLMLQDLPSNARDLARLVTMVPPPALRLAALEAVFGPSTVRRGGALTPERVERALSDAGGNQSQAARLLGVSRGALLRFLQRG